MRPTRLLSEHCCYLLDVLTVSSSVVNSAASPTCFPLACLRRRPVLSWRYDHKPFSFRQNNKITGLFLFSASRWDLSEAARYVPPRLSSVVLLAKLPSDACFLQPSSGARTGGRSISCFIRGSSPTIHWCMWVPEQSYVISPLDVFWISGFIILTITGVLGHFKLI